VEGVVCQADELAEDEMKVCELPGDHGRVLVVKHAGTISALGTKCSHYGAPLEKGVLANGRVRCPWHGACFNIATGDIEDFPGLDGIPCYKVQVTKKGEVKVRANKQHVHENKRLTQLAGKQASSQDTILVIGGGAAGASCVEAARKRGFTGRLVLATMERHLPYDRPKLSKALDMQAEKMQLRPADFYQAADIEVLKEHAAVSVQSDKRSVTFANGAEISYTTLVVATGSRPRRPPFPGVELDGVFTLRSPEDGNAMAARLLGKDVVILGTSFIGMEVAAFCAGKAASVTVVGSSAVPYARSLGPRVGAMLQALHQEKGVVIKNELSVKELRGLDGRLTQVVLTDGTELPAEACLLGVGVMPCTEFLQGVVDLDERGNVLVDKHLRTSVPSILAAGDMASYPLPLAGGARAVTGHWQLSSYHGRVAGETAAGADTEINTVPFFWTQMFGKSIRYAGHCPRFDDILYDGEVEHQKFVAFYCCGDEVHGVASMNRDPAAAYWAEQMAHSGYPSKQEVLKQLENK